MLAYGAKKVLFGTSSKRMKHVPSNHIERETTNIISDFVVIEKKVIC